MTLAELFSEEIENPFVEDLDNLTEEEFEELVEAKKVSPLDYDRYWKEWPLDEKHYSKKTGNRLYGRWIYRHREAAGAKYGDGKVVHHKNHNKHDNSKRNLSKISREEHCKVDPNARKCFKCKVCGGEHFARGYCQKCYMRRFRKGNFGDYKKSENYSKSDR